MPNKFFLISQVFYPDQVSTASLFTDLCSVLSGDGIEVEVWAAHPSYTNQEKQPSFLLYNGIKIKYLPSTNFRKKNLAGRIVNILTFIIFSGIKLLFSKEKTPVWTHTTPPFLGIVLSVICKLKNRKFNYILLDILPEGLIRLNKANASNLFVRFWGRSFIKTLRRSERVVVIGRDMLKWVEYVSPENISKTVYIPHWQDDSLITPGNFNSNSIVEEYCLNNKFVVQYCGNMGLWNNMASIGKAVSMKPDNVNFLFTGDGIRKNELLNHLQPNLDNFKLLDFQPKGKLNEALSACHVHLVSLANGMQGMAVPSKIYGILASGRAVIAMVPYDSEIAMLVREDKCGIVINPSDSLALYEAILFLKNNEEILKKFGNNARKAFLEKYTTRIISEKYKSIILESF